MPSEQPHPGARSSARDPTTVASAPVEVASAPVDVASAPVDVASAPGTLVGLIAVAALVLLALARPIAYGASARDVLATWLFLGAWVVLPGWTAWRGLARERRGTLEELSIGTALGFALEVLAFVASRALHVESAFLAWPLSSLAFALLARGRTSPREPVAAPARARELLVLLAIAAAAVVRARMRTPESWWSDLDFDTLFHAGNVASVARGLPYEDARVAGVAVNYHFFAYALAAGLRQVAGVAGAAAYERVLGPVLPLVLALQVFAFARTVAGSARAGLVASALVVLHADLGFDLVRVLGERGKDLDLHSYLEYGIYRSPSMALGLVLFVGLAHAVAIEVRDRAWRPSRSLAAIAVLALAASGTKGSVMPVAAGGAVLAVLVMRRRASRALVVSSVVLALAAAPMTSWLAFGGASHGQAIFHVAPWHALYSTGAFDAIARALGATAETAPRWLEWALCAPWIALVYGPCTVAALLHLRARGAAATEVERWLAATAVAGSVAAFALGASGVSELFFADCAHVSLAVLAAAWLANATVPLRARLSVAILLGAAPAAGCAIDLAAQLRRDLRTITTTADEPALAAEYRAAMEWIRTETPSDAVVLATAPAQLHSTYCERRSFYEIESTLASTFARSWRRVGGRWWPDGPVEPQYRERRSLRERFAASPDVELVREARDVLEGAPPVVAIVDRLRLSHRGAIGTHWEVDPVGERGLIGLPLVFENAAARVYVLDGSSRR